MTLNELFEFSFIPANGILSILLILSIVYWLFTMLTGIGDFDVDLDIETDGDIDNPEGIIEVPQDPSYFLQFLKFLNLDIIPITFFVTLAILFAWAINVNLSYFLPLPNWFFFITILPAIIVGIIIARYLCLPLKPFFKELNHKGEIAYDYLGRSGKLITNVEGDKIGMLEIIINKDPIKIMVKSKTGDFIEKGKKVVILDEEKNKKFYLVEETFEI